MNLGFSIRNIRRHQLSLIDNGEYILIEFDVTVASLINIYTVFGWMEFRRDGKYRRENVDFLLFRMGGK